MVILVLAAKASLHIYRIRHSRIPLLMMIHERLALMGPRCVRPRTPRNLWIPVRLVGFLLFLLFSEGMAALASTLLRPSASVIKPFIVDSMREKT